MLAVDGCTDFWECPVDDCDTYKLYNSAIDAKCKEIEIIVILFEEEEERKTQIMVNTGFGISVLPHLMLGFVKKLG